MNHKTWIVLLEYVLDWVEFQGEQGRNNSIAGKYRAIINLEEVIKGLGQSK